MAGFKRSQPGIRFSGERITPDESDEYVTYAISNPGTANPVWFGTAPIAGTSGTNAFVITNLYPDYPRNVLFSMTGSAAGMAGTVTVVGVDQFGSAITETISYGTASNGGTSAGTKVFGRVNSATMQFGTAVGNGTPKLGLVNGTSSVGTCYFGLPVKIQGTADIRFASIVAGTGPVSFNGGSVSSYIGTAMSSIYLGGYSQTGSETINIWIQSSFVPDYITTVSNMKLVG